MSARDPRALTPGLDPQRLSAPAHRPIRTTALRPPRARGARRAAREPLPRLAPGPLDLDALFGRRAPRVADLGCGTGESLLALAQARPECDFLGVELYGAGVARALEGAGALGLRNVHLLHADVREVLAALPDAALDEAWVLFPDPWPKRRHHKRRLVDAPFAATLSRCLRTGGLVRLATDWPDYGAQMREAFAGVPTFTPVAPPPRPETKYARRAQRLGHTIAELAFRKV